MSVDALRAALLDLLVERDPLGVSRERDAGDIRQAYLMEADVLADLLGGSQPDLPHVTSVVWAVIAGAAGVDATGPRDAYAELGAAIAKLVRDGPPEGHETAVEAVVELDDGPGDPLVAAVNASLDDRDPLALHLSVDDASEAIDEWPYEPIAEELVAHLDAGPRDDGRCRELASEVLEGQPAALDADAAEAFVGDLIEIVALEPYLRAELPAVEVAVDPLPRPRDPLCAGILAILARHDPVRHDEDSPLDEHYLAEAEELAGLLRSGAGDVEHCASVVWAVVRQWTTAEDAGSVRRYRRIAREIVDLVALYREVASSYPELVRAAAAEPVVLDDPLCASVLRLLSECDPADVLDGSLEPSGDEYLAEAAELAARLREGVPDAAYCQVLAWRVLEPIGGPLRAYRDVGRELYALVA